MTNHEQEKKHYDEDPNTTHEQPSKIKEIDKRKENEKNKQENENYSEDPNSTEEDSNLHQ